MKTGHEQHKFEFDPSLLLLCNSFIALSLPPPPTQPLSPRAAFSRLLHLVPSGKHLEDSLSRASSRPLASSPAIQRLLVLGKLHSFRGGK
ncbi:hypothetical protein NL676_015747 [Syzygium grande]|nr:hypothetical protein NL676_015747 [Syzygium grande]